MRKLFLLVALICMFVPVLSARAAGLSLNIYYAGPDGGVRTALGLDKDVRFTSDPALADVFVLNGQIPSVDAASIHARVQGGAGLLLVLGPNLTGQAVGNLLGGPIRLVAKNSPLSLAPLAGSPDSVVKSVIWDSVPQVRERFTLSGSRLTALVTGFEDNSLVLGTQKIGSGQAFVLTAFLDSNTNTELQQWPYF